MSEIAIQARGIGKQYILGGRKRRGDSMREAIAKGLSAPFKLAWRGIRRLPPPPSEKNIFWALKNVDFDIYRGDTVGIIGRNGAGKSTLLKVLSRITEPTEGMIDLYGRVGALLEVGTGFHPELTGRENIFLNGAVLGMSRTEIRHKFDEIVDFSGVERFLDTPIKRYSSGMLLRLGFSVAAHLETEILIVDEVLAVGDAEFQRKCLGKMQDVANTGRTILFVSHNINAILNLCKSAIYLSHGQVQAVGDVRDVTQQYTAYLTDDDILGRADLTQHRGRSIGMTPIFQHIRLLNESHTPITDFKTGDTVVLEIGYDARDKIYDDVHISIQSRFGESLFTVSTRYDMDAPQKISGTGTLLCTLPNLPLYEGDYTLMLSIGDKMGDVADTVEAAMSFRVWFNDYFKTGNSPPTAQGYFIQSSSWKLA
ncbi:MAG: ABC transporter ATP-binding protein [Anaerolineae bacterium]|nr:ABC transporter ATP-binding protein [Anaerolineae bacterium]